MISAEAPKSSLIPQDLNTLLPHRQTPWNVSSTLFNRLKAQASDQPFKLCEVLNSDPETNFILKYFEHQKPPGYSIKRIVCIHNPDHTQVFEGTLKNIDREANNPFFAPKGKDEEPKTDRARVLARWEQQVAQFSPVEVKSSNSREADKCSKAKVLPLWHGSSLEVCKSVFSSGFTSFGKHHFWEESANKGNTKNTDKGYFGSGIYFTNSAHYASMYSEGHLLFAWVSMREPYPVVSDKPHPENKSCTDMKNLGGKEHYQNYNAHYIPVVSGEPNNPQCIQYYPCYKEQPPAWDEFVFFYPGQALPRFWIEIAVDFPKVALSDIGTSGELLTLLLNLLNKVEIQQQAALAQMLQTKVDAMLDQVETTLLGADDQRFLKLAKRLLSEGEKLNSASVNMLLKMGTNIPSMPSSAAPMKASSQPFSVDSLATILPKAPVKPTLPAIAFGKELWANYLGDVGEEPPLPADIDKILQSPCPFFPGKKVEETHLLTLIPKTVNGQLLTLDFLEELVKNPKQGQATQYSLYLDDIKKEYGSQPTPGSYWVLMTRDVIPKSRYKSYDDQKQLLASYSQKAHVPYEVPHLLEAAVSIFMEYLKTGQRLYSDNPWTYTRCQERVSSFPDWPLAIGDFTDGGFGGLVVNGSGSGNVNGGVGGLRKLNDSTQQLTVEEQPKASLSSSQIVTVPPQTVPSPLAAAVNLSSPSLSVVSLDPILTPAAMLVPIVPYAPVPSLLPAIAFGKELWAKYLGDIGEEPPLPSDIQQILQSPCPFFPDKRVEETHLLTLIPKTVNGKPLTLNSLENLVKHPKQGKATEYKSYWSEIRKEYSSQPPLKSYWVLMTRDVIAESGGKSYDAQKQLLESYSQKAHVPYEVPHLLEAVVSIFMEYLKTGQRLYSDNPSTYTRCQERVSKYPSWPLAVGGFDERGLSVYHSYPGIDYESDGLGGLRKF